jgi:hypothetical protein
MYYSIGEGVIIKNKVCFRQLASRPTRLSIIKLMLSFRRCCFIPFKKKNDIHFKMAVAIPGRLYVMCAAPVLLGAVSMPLCAVRCRAVPAQTAHQVV